MLVRPAHPRRRGVTALAALGLTLLALVAATMTAAPPARAASLPSAPTSVSATTSGTAATLVWAPPSSTGGSPVTSYVLARDGKDSTGYGAWSGSVSASARSATFTSLVLGATYHLSVRAVTAAGTGPVASVTAVVAPSGVAMPTGDLPGWRQVFSEDFNATVARGSWPGSYATKWADYTGGPDTAKVGYWNAKTTVSASGGAADYYLHSENGVPQCAAILPRLASQTYGRYTVRFAVDAGLKDWSSAWLLWPDDEVWPAHGEMDWPEGELTGPMTAFTHFADPAGGQQESDTTTAFASGWHTATTEWTPGKVRYLLDGTVIGTSTTKVSSYPMHWVLQSETAYGHKPTSAGHIKIDWVTVYARA